MAGTGIAPCSITLDPIGVVRTPFAERVEAPRQPHAAQGVEGRVQLFSGRGFEDALVDLAQWDHVWLVVWFHKNADYRPKVQPPRSPRKHGVFATRAPYRPNPIGLSAVRLLRVAGLELVVSGVDLLDGTPLLDLKPYVPYTDAIVDANHGWLAGGPPDPIADYEVVYEPLAALQLEFLAGEHDLALRSRIDAALRLGPSPHAYRRIRRMEAGYRLSVKDWRVRFAAEGRRITVLGLSSGYRPSELFSPEGRAPQAHRAFVAKWPGAIDP